MSQCLGGPCTPRLAGRCCWKGDVDPALQQDSASPVGASYDEEGPSVYRLSLRFSSQITETSFLCKRADRIAGGLLICGWCLVLGGIIALARGNFDHRSGYIDNEAFQVWIYSSIADGVLAFWGVLAVIFGFLQKRLNFAPPFACELACTVFCLGVSVAGYFTEASYVARAMGVRGPRAGLACHSIDAWPVLMCNIIVAASHILMSVRWCVLWPVEIACFLTYLLPIAFAQPELFRNSPFTHTVVFLLVVLSAVGARTTELTERRAYWAYLREKTLRVETEFLLSVREEELARDAKERYSERAASSQRQLSSCASTRSMSTTATGKLFQGQGASAMQMLANLMRIGTKEKWLLPPEQFTMFPQDVLGAGGFGVVVRGQFKGTDVAMKVPRQAWRHTATAVQHLPSLANELRILRHLNHPNIVLFFGAVVDVELGEITLVLELVDGASLDEYVKKGSPAMSERYNVMLGVCCALQFMHEHIPVLVHGDIKSSNILVKEGGHAKVLDFGLSRAISRHGRPLGGTLSWMAPEVYNAFSSNKSAPSRPADVFSFGCVVHFLVTGHKSQHGVSQRAMLHTIRSGTLPPLAWPAMTSFLWACRDLVDSCTSVDARLRPRMSEVLATLRVWPQRLAELEGRVSPSSSSSLGASSSGTTWCEGVKQVRDRASRGAFWMRERRARVSEVASNNNNARCLPTVPEVDPAHTVLDLDTEDCAHELRFGSGHEDGDECGRYKVTPMETQRIMLADVLLRWYTERSYHCCAFHAAVDNMSRLSSKLCTELKKAQCSEVFAHAAGTQCPSCGVLSKYDDFETNHKGRECDVCLWRSPLHPVDAGPEPDTPADWAGAVARRQEPMLVSVEGRPIETF